MRRGAQMGAYMDFKNKCILVVGVGISGIAAVELLSKESADIILYDTNEKLRADDIKLKLPEHFTGKIIIGKLSEEIKLNIELVILSPGVPTDLNFVLEFQTRHIPVWGEIELAYQFSKGRIAAITGTNGKTTTTALVGEIMRSYYDSVFIVGNIGTPYTQMVKETTEFSVTVAEMSSFQLETVESFKPNVSAILNITPDHLDRHHSMDNYILAKENITKNQDASDTCVLNYEDSRLREMGETLSTNVVWFSSERKLEKGLYLDSDLILYNYGHREEIVCNIHELNIFGKHNYENVMAAVAIGVSLSVPMECIHKALVQFVAVEHRIEYVTTKHGVKYYNDSKGTNPDASIQAVKAMKTKTLLIAGGYDKGSDYDDFIRAFDGKIKYLVLLGQTREKMAKAAKRLLFEDIIFVDNLKEAVDFCAKHAGAGESVLLSPCCASWGMFNNYEERGRMFKEYVHGII